MDTRKLGTLDVSAIGLGCMGMSAFCAGGNEADGIATIRHALERDWSRSMNRSRSSRCFCEHVVVQVNQPDAIMP